MSWWLSFVMNEYQLTIAQYNSDVDIMLIALRNSSICYQPCIAVKDTHLQIKGNKYSCTFLI